MHTRENPLVTCHSVTPPTLECPSTPGLPCYLLVCLTRRTIAQRIPPWYRKRCRMGPSQLSPQGLFRFSLPPPKPETALDPSRRVTCPPRGRYRNSHAPRSWSICRSRAAPALGWCASWFSFQVPANSRQEVRITFLPCGHLDFAPAVAWVPDLYHGGARWERSGAQAKAAVIAQNDEFKCSFGAMRGQHCVKGMRGFETQTGVSTECWWG